MINEKNKPIFEVNEYDMKENEIFHSFEQRLIGSESG
jgi:uncharacterized protein YpmB